MRSSRLAGRSRSKCYDGCKASLGMGQACRYPPCQYSNAPAQALGIGYLQLAGGPQRSAFLALCAGRIATQASFAHLRLFFLPEIMAWATG